MTKANLLADFGELAGTLRLEYQNGDNVLPSKEKDALAREEGPSPTVKDRRAALDRLRAKDEEAWRKRKLRLYPAGPTDTLVSSHGTVRLGHMEMTAESELLVFQGTETAQLKYPATSVSLQILGAAFDTSGQRIGNPSVRYLGNGVVLASQPAFFVVQASYSAEYQVVELEVEPTGKPFDVLVAAFRGTAFASVVVPFELEVFDPEEPVIIGRGGFSMKTDWPGREDLIESEEWTETGRVTSRVDVDGVSISRIERVTLRRDDGRQMTLRFRN